MVNLYLGIFLTGNLLRFLVFPRDLGGLRGSFSDFGKAMTHPLWFSQERLTKSKKEDPSR
jgi:hypothetical protein